MSKGLQGVSGNRYAFQCVKELLIINLLICIDDNDNIESRGTGSIAAEMAEGPAPGICIADIDELNRSSELKTRLIEFGYSAKTVVLAKAKAYRLADDAGIYLEETGGTGDGFENCYNCA